VLKSLFHLCHSEHFTFNYGTPLSKEIVQVFMDMHERFAELNKGTSNFEKEKTFKDKNVGWFNK